MNIKQLDSQSNMVGQIYLMSCQNWPAGPLTANHCVMRRSLTCMMGRTKAKVLPLPVGADTHRSLGL